MYQQPLYQQYVSITKKHGGLAITSFVLGVVAVVFGFLPLTFWIAIPCGAIALVFGIVGRGHGWGKTGIILGVIAFALGIWGAIIVNKTVDNVNHDLNTLNNCIQAAQTQKQIDACY